MLYKFLNSIYKYLKIELLPIILVLGMDEEIIRYIINKGFIEGGDYVALGFCTVITGGAIVFLVQYFKLLKIK